MTSEDEINKALHHIDETSEKLWREGYELEFLDCMELGLAKRKSIFGVESKELSDACKKCGETFNEIAQKKMNEGKVESAFEYLKRGEKVVAKNNPETLFMIINNMVSLEQKQGNTKIALKYLLRALDICKSIHKDKPLRLAQIHLNLCAMASNLQRHSFALKHGKEAIKILEELHDKSIRVNPLNSRKDCNSDERISDLYETLAVAYFNTGVEHEHLHEFNLSYNCYQKGQEVTLQYLSNNHLIVHTLNESIEAVSKKVQNSHEETKNPFE